MKYSGLFLFCLLFLFTGSLSAQWLKASGKKIIDDSGREVLLRGMGLGGWMIQEGYMMETSDFAGPQREIKAKIKNLIGQDNTDAFYRAWHQNHCTKRDIDSLAAWGFNSVRLPMHYNLFTLPIEEEPIPGENTWLTEGFQLTDSLLSWCAIHQMYVILDLHAAPGGQGRDANISDYDPSKPSLWESELNKQKTIALWRKLAERYSGNPWIGGYDLINETNWNFTIGGNQNGCSETSNAPLRQLLMDITAAIRQVDHRHIIIIEGNCWGNNYNGIFPPWDNNMVVSFHKYWSVNDQGSIQGMLNYRNQYNLPVWCGESGENSNVWFTDAIRLLEKNNIGWAWWPLKKISSVVNPLTISRSAGYTTLLNFWKNGGTQPSLEFAKNALMQLAENTRNENCIYRKDVIDAMFRQVTDTTAVPFIGHIIPGIVHATDFDLGGNTIAYSDTDIADYHVTTGNYTAWNSGWNYRNDGVDIEPSLDSDPASNGYNIGWTQTGEWMQYTIHVDTTAAYTVLLRYSNPTGSASRIKLQSGGADLTPSQLFPATGVSAPWTYLQIREVALYQGLNRLRIYFEKGGANLGFFKVYLEKPLTEVRCLPISAETGTDNEFIYLTVNKKLADSVLSASDFTCMVNGSIYGIASLTYFGNNHSQIRLSLNTPIFDSDEISLDYSGSNIIATDGTTLQQFLNLRVKNNLPVHFAIPGKIEAEDFSLNHGLQLENTTDTGGGLNIGYTNTGDYLEYRIRVGKTAQYYVEIRAACQSNAGKLQFQQVSADGSILNTITADIPVTGGWQVWNTIIQEMNLTQGTGKLRVTILKPEFNLNWFNFTEIKQDTTPNPNPKQQIKVYPNPVKGELKIRIPGSKDKNKVMKIFSVEGILVKEDQLSPSEEIYTTNTGNLKSGTYIVQVDVDSDRWRTKLTVF